MFIAYASAPGHTASDIGDYAGPYAAALAAELGRPGLDHLNLFQNVKEAVLAATGGAQQPWESNGLGRRIYLTGQPSPVSLRSLALGFNSLVLLAFYFLDPCLGQARIKGIGLVLLFKGLEQTDVLRVLTVRHLKG